MSVIGCTGAFSRATPSAVYKTPVGAATAAVLEAGVIDAKGVEEIAIEAPRSVILDSALALLDLQSWTFRVAIHPFRADTAPWTVETGRPLVRVWFIESRQVRGVEFRAGELWFRLWCGEVCGFYGFVQVERTAEGYVSSRVRVTGSS